jgi:hypothetical protein
MGDIYHNAEQVLVRLGPDHTQITARKTFNALREITQPSHLKAHDPDIQRHMEEVVKSK